MNTFLWVLQAIGALLYGSSGAMKVFFFDKISHDVPSFGALSRGAWRILGIIELICAAALIVPVIVPAWARLVVPAAGLLAAESLVFIWVHVKYRESGPIALSALLGLLMLFLAYGRTALHPLI